MGACLPFVVTLKGRKGWTGVAKAGDEEGASEESGATPRPVNIAPAMSLCLRRLLGLRFIVIVSIVQFSASGSSSVFKTQGGCEKCSSCWLETGCWNNVQLLSSTAWMVADWQKQTESIY